MYIAIGWLVFGSFCLLFGGMFLGLLVAGLCQASHLADADAEKLYQTLREQGEGAG